MTILTYVSLLASAALLRTAVARSTNSTAGFASCPRACNVLSNSCDALTAPTCIYPDPRVPSPRAACACRPGFKATGCLDSDVSRQWRLPILGQEHRVWVAEDVKCDTLCTIPWGAGSCQEVMLIVEACETTSPGNLSKNEEQGFQSPVDNTTHHPKFVRTAAADEASGAEDILPDLPPLHPITPSKRSTHFFSPRQEDTVSGGPFLQGTNEDVDGTTPRLSGASLVAIDYSADMNSYISEPYGYNGACTMPLTNQHILGGELSSMDIDAVFYPIDKDIDGWYVTQGAIGNCEFGASILTLLSTGRLQNLLNRIGPATSDSFPTGRLFSANFILNGNYKTKQVILLDDKIARKDPADTGGCNTYLSFQPFNGSYFIPLLEKAFAKFVDNYPNEFRATSLLAHDLMPEVYGINGLAGIRGTKVIQALRGGAAHDVLRASNDAGTATPAILKALTDCVTLNYPCTCGTPSLFDRNNNNQLFFWGLMNQHDLPGGNGGKTVDLVDGWVANNMPTIWGGILFELVNDVRKERYAMVGGHAYSISRGNSPDTLLLGNPWGYQPNGPNGYPPLPGNTPFYEMPIALAASFLERVEWTV